MKNMVAKVMAKIHTTEIPFDEPYLKAEQLTPEKITECIHGWNSVLAEHSMDNASI